MKNEHASIKQTEIGVTGFKKIRQFREHRPFSR